MQYAQVNEVRPNRRRPVRLKIIQFVPPEGGEAHICAALFQDRGYVRLISPLLRKRKGILDPRPFLTQFPDATTTVDQFENAMIWLDSVCFDATNTAMVRQACEDAADLGLHFMRYDGSDATLGMSGLLSAAAVPQALSKPATHRCLMESLHQILKTIPQERGWYMGAAGGVGSVDVATVYFGRQRSVRVRLLYDLPPSDIVSEGVTAHEQVQEHATRYALLVAPAARITEAQLLTPRVALSNMDPEVILQALEQMAVS